MNHNKILKSLIDQLEKDPTNSELEKLLDEAMALFGGDKIKEHLTKIIKDRTIVVGGDTGHLSVEYYVGLFHDLDKPKEYEWRADDYREKELERALHGLIPDIITSVDKAEIDAALAGGDSIVLQASSSCRCYDCAKPLLIAIKGSAVFISGREACERNREFSIEVDFPTGEVVYADWPARFSEMRDAGFIMEQEKESINYIRGQRKRSEEYATQQIVHHSVGNTSPTFYVNKNTHAIQIGGGTYNEKTDEFTGPEGLTNVGSFCTDLWWVTMIDRQFYDIMAAKLPKKRNAKYYAKEVKVAHIEPGRYRFTCYGDAREESGQPFMVAERIGDASDFVPAYSSDKTMRAMTVDEAISHMARKYYSMGSEAITQNARFRLMDQTFNVLGNGISTKGDFMSYYGVPNSTVVELLPKDDTAPLDMGFVYPNFQEEYSLLYQMKLTDIPTDWLENALWFYNECKTFFLNGAEGYSNAYPNKDKKRDDDFRAIIERIGTEYATEAEWYSYVSKTYGNGHTEFKGDFHDWRTRSWENEKARIIAFIDKTTALIQKTLDKRK